jgi:hypothetical protein
MPTLTPNLVYIHKCKMPCTRASLSIGALLENLERFVCQNFSEKREVYRVSQEECARLRESVPYVKLYRYNPTHLYPKLNGYGDNGERNVWASGVST